MHSERPDLTQILRTYDQQAETPVRLSQHTDPDPGPMIYGTGLDAAEGLWLRSGWAGRG